MGILEYNPVTNNWIVNYDLISKKIYKLLPIYEGKVKGSDVKLQKDIAYGNFIKNLDVLTSEIRGVFAEAEIHKNLSEAYVALLGLKGIDGDSHEAVRNVILHCVNLLNEMGR